MYAIRGITGKVGGEIARHPLAGGQSVGAVLRDQGVIAIPKASRPESQKANLDALGISSDMKDRDATAALPKGFVRPPFAPEWDAVACRA